MRLKRRKSINISIFLIVIGLAFVVQACNSEYTPRPKDFPVMTLPKDHEYQHYTSNNCPYSFEYSKYAEILRDSQIFNFKPANDCWLNIHYPSLNATVYLSYKALSGRYTIEKLKNDAHKLTYEHAKKASFIEPIMVKTSNHVYGLIFDVGGAAASPTQFFITDTVSHWLRGALYFRTEPNPDSLKPATKYINLDIHHLIESVHWQ